MLLNCKSLSGNSEQLHRGAIEKTKDAVPTAAANYKPVKVTEFNNSFEQLQRDIKSISDTATLAEAKVKIKPDLQSVQAASQQMRSSVQCP
ncbi:MAG TPA: hypothetical protein V6C57_19995 [Coleofasciculaceae cyanobacterium]